MNLCEFHVGKLAGKKRGTRICYHDLAMKNQETNLRASLLDHLKKIGADKLPDRVIDSIESDLEEKLDGFFEKNVTIKTVTRHFRSVFESKNKDPN